MFEKDACECGINRRTMLAFLFGGAAAVAAYVFRGRHYAGDRQVAEEKAEEEIAIGSFDDYPPGAVREFRGEKIIVLADEDGVYAMSLLCTHKLKLLDYDQDKGEFVCPAHGAIFAKDGTVMRRPATADLPWYRVREKAGKLWVNTGEIVPKGTKTKRPAANA